MDRGNANTDGRSEAVNYVAHGAGRAADVKHPGRGHAGPEHGEAGLAGVVLVDEALAVVTVTDPDEAAAVKSTHEPADVAGIAFPIDRAEAQDGQPQIRGGGDVACDLLSLQLAAAIGCLWLTGRVFVDVPRSV